MTHVRRNSSWPRLLPAQKIVRRKWRFGFIDSTGEYVIPPNFEEVNQFVEGRAVFSKGKRYGYIDVHGKVVVPARFDVANPFNCGRAVVMIGNNQGVIDRFGKIIVPIGRYSWTGWVYGEGMLPFQSKSSNKFGFLDVTGEVAISPRFGIAGFFSEGLALAAMPGESLRGYVSHGGEFVIEPRFHHAQHFSEGLACVSESLNALPNSYINRSGLVIIPPHKDWRDNGAFSEGLASVSTERGAGYIDKEGNFVIGPVSRYARCLEFRDGMGNFIEKETELEGFVDRVGNEVFPAQFGSADYFIGGIANVDGVYINKKGKLIWARDDERPKIKYQPKQKRR